MHVIGKPISEIEYPALTICSQGWVPDVVHKVLDRQFEDYLKSINVSMVDLNQVKINHYKEEYANATYPGLKLPPEKIISQLISQNPAVTLSSEVLVDKGDDECKDVAGDTEQDLKCPDGPGGPWDMFQMNRNGKRQILCIKDVTLGQGTSSGSSYSKDSGPGMKGDACTRYGANRLRFDVNDIGLPQKLFELYCDYNNDPGACKYRIPNSHHRRFKTKLYMN